MREFERRCVCGGPISWEPRGHHADAPTCTRCGPVTTWDVTDRESGAVLIQADLDAGPVGGERLLVGLARFIDPLPRERAA